MNMSFCDSESTFLDIPDPPNTLFIDVATLGDSYFTSRCCPISRESLISVQLPGNSTTALRSSITCALVRTALVLPTFLYNFPDKAFVCATAAQTQENHCSAQHYSKHNTSRRTTCKLDFSRRRLIFFRTLGTSRLLMGGYTCIMENVDRQHAHLVSFRMRHWGHYFVFVDRPLDKIDL